MKIGQKRPDTNLKTSVTWLVFAVCFVALTLLLTGSGSMIQTWRRLADSTDLFQAHRQADTRSPTLSVDMRMQNYNTLLQQREQAVQSGVYIPANRDYMTATIQIDNSSIPVLIRPYPGPAEHLRDDTRWRFDIRTRQNQQLLGMQRFYLLPLAEGDGLYQWAFFRALEREGILATRYQFVNLVFNGDSWGRYALQEGFGDELMTTNGRTAGVILEFDAELLWKSIDHFGSAESVSADPIANLLATDFRYFEIDTFREATVAQDEERSAQKDAGIGRLRALQAGQVRASEIFDVTRLARFLALVDLWGANEAISLANLRYYYNPDTNRLEPIGFGVGSPHSEERLPLEATYFDSFLQAAYVREAERLSRPAYLADLMAELEPKLQELQRSLRTAGGEEPFPWEMLKERQEQIRRSLNPVQPVFAYLGPPRPSISATIQIDIANVTNLPVEILGFDVDGLTFLEADSSWLHTEASTGLFDDRDDKVVLTASNTPILHYVRFDIPILEIIRLDEEINYRQPIEVHVATRILGLDTHQLTLAREGVAELLSLP
jgi:hypothetical protein